MSGSVSHGTLREQDLIPTFLEELEAKDSHITFTISEVRLLVDMLPVGSGYYFTNDADAETASYLMEKMFDALNQVAPEDHYFGAHPGDGSDFGYWPIEDYDD